MKLAFMSLSTSASILDVTLGCTSLGLVSLVVCLIDNAWIFWLETKHFYICPSESSLFLQEINIDLFSSGDMFLLMNVNRASLQWPNLLMTIHPKWPHLFVRIGQELIMDLLVGVSRDGLLRWNPMGFSFPPDSRLPPQ